MAIGTGTPCTRVGTIDVAVPKLRTGSYFPDWLLERRKRAESELITVDADAYLAAVSTRHMDKLIGTLGINLNRSGFDGGSDDTDGSLSWDLRKYPDGLRERATRMALDALADPAWAKGAIRWIGEELGVHPEALRTWVKKAQVDGDLRPGTTTDQAQRIKELKKEVRELRRANAILKSTVGLSIAAECERLSR